MFDHYAFSNTRKTLFCATKLLQIPLFAMLGLLSCFLVPTTAQAEEIQATPITQTEGIQETASDREIMPITQTEETQATPTDNKSTTIKPLPVLSDPQDPQNQIRDIRQRGLERDSLIPVSLLGGVRNATDKARNFIYDAVNLDLGLSFHHAFQWLTDSLPDKDRWGTATDMDFVGTWELINVKQPSQGQLFFGIEGRWEYGTTGPQNLGFQSLGSLNGTANTFSAYDPTFILRNLYWQQGSREAGWFYRIGKITPDAILGSSKYLNPNTTFLPNGGTGFFSNALPDSGLGVTGGLEVGDRFAMIAVISDANGDRFTFGDLSKGQFYTAIEFAGKIAPRTEKAGYSKLTLWNNPGGKAINGSTGRPGAGFTLKLEQELTADGRLIGILRWGRSFNDSALYRQQVGAHLVFNEPRLLSRLKNDAVGLAFNWIQSPTPIRNEYDLEFFYRFPLFPLLDTTFHFQQVFNPVSAPDIDTASVFSIRLTTKF